MEERYQKLHQQFFWCMLVLIGVISIIQVVSFFVAYRGEMSWMEYSDLHFWLPLVANSGGVMVLRSVLESPNITLEWKKYATVFYLEFMATVLAICHGGSILVLFSCYQMPILWSATYGKKKIALVSHLIGQASMLGFMIYFWVTENVNGILNAIVVMVTLMLSHFLAYMLMEFIREKDDIIRSHIEDNENLGERLLREPMTGLYNHAAFHSLLEQKIRERGRNPLSLAIIDIDNFKMVNDTFGHNNGDKVILALAEVLKRNCGEHYFPCRYGGEEFAVIMPGLKEKEAVEKMEEVLAEFRSLHYDWNTGPAVTFSCGVFQHSEFNMSASELFRITDQMLYKAKQSGKNCCNSKL